MLNFEILTFGPSLDQYVNLILSSKSSSDLRSLNRKSPNNVILVSFSSSLEAGMVPG